MGYTALIQIKLDFINNLLVILVFNKRIVS